MYRLGVIVLVSALFVPTFAATKPQMDVVGVGAYPVSDEVSALWLNGPATGSRPQPLIMVYYHGAAKWHDRKWQIDSKIGKSPARARLVSGDLELIIEYGSGGREVKVQGQLVDLSVANVFLVSPIGQAEKPTVTGVGLVRFEVPAEGNPAVYVLASNPDISKKVLK